MRPYFPVMRVTFDSLTLVKFVLAIAGFVLLTLYGVRSKRIAGVLITFPILNGIALLTSPDPFRVAEAVYPLVMFNSVLFWVAISTVRLLPPRTIAFPELILMTTRLSVWGIAWTSIAYQLTEKRDEIPASPVLFIAYCTVVAGVIYSSWRRPVEADETKIIRSRRWLNWVLRITLFAAIFFCLLYTAQNASDQKWAGMASAFPLAGLFALASLSVSSADEQLMPIRDTVLLGPLLVVPFNWSFCEVITSLPVGPLGETLGVLALIFVWAIALALVIWLVPILERCLDAQRL